MPPPARGEQERLQHSESTVQERPEVMQLLPPPPPLPQMLPPAIGDGKHTPLQQSSEFSHEPPPGMQVPPSPRVPPLAARHVRGLPGPQLALQQASLPLHVAPLGRHEGAPV